MAITKFRYLLRTLFTRKLLCSSNFLLFDKALGVFLVVYLIFSLLACSSSTSPTQTNSAPSKPLVTPSLQPRQTATTFPKGILLYQADWSHGLAGWRGSTRWKATQGYLQTDLSDNASITAPYMPAVSNYAVEFRLKVVSVSQNGGSFFIAADKVPGKDGYQASVLNIQGPRPRPDFSHPQIQVLIDPLDSMEPGSAQIHDFEPGFQWRTYRIEVQGEQVVFFVNDFPISRAVSTKTDMLSNGPIRLESGNAIVQVSSFRVTSL